MLARKSAGQPPSEEQPTELQHFDTKGVLLGSGFHQDACEHGSDRSGELQFWMAMEEVSEYKRRSSPRNKLLTQAVPPRLKQAVPPVTCATQFTPQLDFQRKF